MRTHLVAIVGLLAVTLLGVGGYQALDQFREARQNAGLDTAYQAELAADALSTSLQDARSFTSSTAANPSIAQLFSQIDGHYKLCTLTAGGSGVFPEGAIHFIDTSGFLFCSSAGKGIFRRGISYAGLAAFKDGLTATSGSPVQEDPFLDPATGKRSIAFAAPIAQGTDVLGVVVVALPVAGVASEIASTYGGREPLIFDVVLSGTGEVVSSSETTDPDSIRVDLRTPPDGAMTGLDGTRRLYRAVPADDTGFTVVAGTSEARTLAVAWQSLWSHLGLTVLALLVTLGAGLLINRRIGRPIRRLTAALDQAAGALTTEPVELDGPREIRALAQEFNEMLAARASIETELRERAMFDELTHLPNRTVALDRISQGLERTRRRPDHMAVLSLDLDRFSKINDGFGRDVGDRMLIQVANRIRSVLRPGDTIARFYGDEFVVLCEGVASREEAEIVAERIAEALRVPIREGDHEATLSVSIGIVLGRFERDSAETLLRDADTARTKAKERGKARHEFFDETMREGVSSRLDLENELRRAVERDELHLAYQPIVDLASGRIVGAEALVRWHHPTKGVLLPGVFLELAEETGLIIPIGRRSLDLACRQAAEWSADGHRIRVSVNLSPRELAEPGLEEAVRVILGTTHLDPSLLCIEITENTLMREDAAAEVLERLRAIGAAISVDDFGTGYSSLAYLQRFPIDELKIDRAFVRDLGTKENASALVAAMVGVARALELSVVAEGIEDETQLKAVRALGCDAVQGFLIMRPQPPEAFDSLLTLDEVVSPDRTAIPAAS